jgi:phenylacetate-CoA ligase
VISGRRLLVGASAPLYELATGRRPWTEYRRRRELQWRSRESLDALALERFQRLLRHAAAHVPYYRDAFRRAGIEAADVRSLDDLTRLPITRKADLRPGFPDAVTADNLPASRRFRTETSGSTGLPFEFYTDRADIDARLGSFMLFWEWAGTPAWEGVMHVVVSLRPAATVDGHSTWVERARQLFLGQRMLRVSGLEASPVELAARLRELPRGTDYLLWGLPSSIARLGARLLASEAVLERPPRVIVASGESLVPTDLETMARAFGCPIVNHYSAYEVLHLAQSCPENPALLHVDPTRAIARVVRDDGRDAAPGEAGRLVLTDLGNWVMPFVNYDIGDRARRGGRCPCGRGFPTLEMVEGRLGETIRTPGGGAISPTVLSWFLIHNCHALPDLWEFQAVQTAPDALTLLVVPTRHFTVETARRLEAELAKFLGAGMRVAVETVDRIPSEPSGKRLIIRSTASV